MPRSRVRSGTAKAACRCTRFADVDYGFAEAKTQYGIIGIKTWIYKGEIFDFAQVGQEKQDDSPRGERGDRGDRDRPRGPRRDREARD